MSPKGPPSYHSKYVYHNFSLKPHACRGDCGCVAVGCTHHWQWKDGKSPPMTIAPWDYQCVDYQLYYFGAYQGPVPGKTKQERFLENYHNIAQWVRRLEGTTIFCNWDMETVADVFEKVKAVFAGHTVPATKALHFFVPDLFIILDRKQVWGNWKTECRSLFVLPSSIDGVSGKDYVALLEHVRVKIASAIKAGGAFTLDGSPQIKVNSIDELRLVTPLQLNMPKKIGHTLGKVIDNIIRDKSLGVSSTIASSGPCGPRPAGSSE